MMMMMMTMADDGQAHNRRIDMVCCEPAISHRHHSSSSIRWIDRSKEERKDVVFMCAVFCFRVLRA